MSRKKRILVAPLDWGLGHASRCIPIIREITTQGHEVILASDGRALELLQAEFPELKCIRLHGYHPVYPKEGSMVIKMATQVPKFLFAIVREHFLLKKIIREHAIDAVISDNRYGLWSNEIPCILLTHQLFIQVPQGLQWLGAPVNKLNHFFIKKFTRCWVPDTKGDNNLSGALAHGKNIPANVEYIGMLSRFTSQPAEKKYDLLVVLSGPEPQRTILERKIIGQIKDLPLRILVVRGVTEENTRGQLSQTAETISHLTSTAMNEVMLQSNVVLCRSGYSTLMELASLEKSAILIPTPGQTEQEYLARLLNEKKFCVTQKQDSLDAMNGVEKVRELKRAKLPFVVEFKDVLLKFLDEIR